MEEQLVFTPSAIAEVLLGIEELSDYDISVNYRPESDTILISIGDSTYSIESNKVTEVKVDPEVVEIVEEIDNSAVEKLESEEDGIEVTVDEEDLEDIEGGILKEIAKTLLVGGVARLAGGALKSYMKS